MLLTLKDKDYLIPEKWTQVSLGKFQNYMLGIDDRKDSKEKNIFTIQTLTGAPLDLLQKCKLKDIEIVIAELNKLLSKKVNTTFNMIINIDGQDYGFHPNLSNLTLGEFVDLDNYCKNIWKNMHKVMAILYREVKHIKGKKYDIIEYDIEGLDRRSKLFKDNMSIATINGASSFFLNIGKEYLMTLDPSLMQEMMKRHKTVISKMQKQASTQSGVGTELSTV